MRIRSPSTARFALLAAASCLLLSGNASALDEAGTIKTLKGTASIEREGKKLAAEPGGKVMVNDRILTAADSTIGITLRDNTLLSAGANSTLVVNRFAFNSTTHAGAVDATLKRGTLAVVSGTRVMRFPLASMITAVFWKAELTWESSFFSSSVR